MAESQIAVRSLRDLFPYFAPNQRRYTGSMDEVALELNQEAGIGRCPDIDGGTRRGWGSEPGCESRSQGAEMPMGCELLDESVVAVSSVEDCMQHLRRI
jgi:hypothetical protein